MLELPPMSQVMVPFLSQIALFSICWALASLAWTVACRSWWETAPSCSAGCSSASSSSSACIAPLIRSIVSCGGALCFSTFSSTTCPASTSFLRTSILICSCSHTLYPPRYDGQVKGRVSLCDHPKEVRSWRLRPADRPRTDQAGCRLATFAELWQDSPHLRDALDLRAHGRRR